MGDGATEINKAGEEAPMSLLGLDFRYIVRHQSVPLTICLEKKSQNRE